MPDGLLVTTLPQTQSLQIDLLPFRDELQKAPSFVYLCIPYLQENAADLSGDLPRYHSHLNTRIVDINTGDQPIDIPRLLPNFSLQLSQEPPAHYTSMPIAQVSYDAKSFFLMEYIPPSVQVTALSDLWQMCNQVTIELRRKYKALCNLAGNISGVKYGELPPRFDGYNHLDIAKSFLQVIGYISRVLKEIEESYTVVPFTLSDRVFTLQLQSSWVGEQFILGAQIQTGVDESTLLDWINNCVIVTDKYISLAKDNRVLGAVRQIVSGVPALHLVPTRGVQLFSVQADARYIDPTGVLCLFNISDDDSTRPAEVVLYNASHLAMTS